MEQITGQGHDIWPLIFLSLGISLALAALLLIPRRNDLPATAKTAKARAG